MGNLAGSSLPVPCLNYPMPRIYRTPKEVEQFLFREFARHLGCRISKPKWQESPDVILTLSNVRGKRRVAIEHTGFYNDTTHGMGSPLTAIGEFWRLVQSSLTRRLSHRKHLTGLLVTVTFKQNPAIPTGRRAAKLPVARLLATELITFVEQHSHVPISRHYRFSNRDHFSHLPTMASLLGSLRLVRFTDEPSFASGRIWECSNITTGFTGINLNYIKTAIDNKNRKALKYNWGDAEQRWLLIASAGHYVNDSAGPREQDVNWDDPDLKTLCRASPFDKIVFWERVGEWHKWLK